MKILHLTDGLPPATLGGTGRIVAEVAIAQARRGHAVTVLSATADDEPPTLHPVVHTEVIRALSERWAHYRCVFSVKRAREVLAVIDRVQPDVIHAHTISRQCGYQWMKGARARGIPTIVTAHDVSHVACGKVTGFEKHLWLKDLRRSRWTWNPARNLLIKRSLSMATKVLCVSDALRTYMECFGYRELTTVHNGIDLEFWREQEPQREARARYQLPKDRTIFLLSGRLGHDKGSVLVAATLPHDAFLVLAGDADTTQFAPVMDRTIFLGRQTTEQMRLLYTACDTVLVPSLCLDCFPTACLEGMAMGRAVIGSSWGGAQESLVSGVTGWIIDPRRPEELKSRLEWCVGHRDTFNTYGSAGRKRAEEHFSLEHHVEQLLDIYEHHIYQIPHAHRPHRT